MFSGLHHDIFRYSEYISLTPSEVRVGVGMGVVI